MVIAKVNNYEILEVEYKAELQNTLLRMKLEEPTLEAKKAAINQLVDGYLLLHKAKESNIKFSSEDIDNKFVEISMNYKTKEEFDKSMKARNLTEKLLREQIVNEITIRNYIQENFSDTKAIDEEQLKKIYKENIKAFQTEAMVKASHILIKDTDDESLEKIDKISKRIKNPENFINEAKLCSDCPSCCNAGDLGYFSRGKMVKEFESAAFDLNVNEISKPIKTKFGYHLIMVTDRKPGKIAEFADVKESLEKRLQQIETELSIIRHIKELRAKADVEIFEDKL